VLQEYLHLNECYCHSVSEVHRKLIFFFCYKTPNDNFNGLYLYFIKIKMNSFFKE